MPGWFRSQQETLKDALGYAASLIVKPSYIRVEETNMTKAETANAIVGVVHQWGDRRFIQTTIPYGRLKDLLQVVRYDHSAGEGYQRPLDAPHVSDLVAKIKLGEFVPTTWYLSLDAWHAENLTTKGDRVEIPVDPAHPYHTEDGQHRTAALEKLRNDPDFGPDRVDAYPIPVMIFLDSDPARRTQSFLALQQGKAVAANLKTSLRLSFGLDGDEVKRKAYEVARKLDGLKSSHLHGVIGWDENRKDRVSISRLLASGKSTMATTLYGGVVLACEKDVDWIVKRYQEVWQALRKFGKPYDEENPDTSTRKILQADRVLSPLGFGGSAYGSHMIVMLGNMLIYRLMRAGGRKPNEVDLRLLVEVAEGLFDVERDDTGAPAGRRDAGEFAKRYFDDLPKSEKVSGVPVGLVEACGSSVGVKSGRKPTKPKRGRGRPPGAKNKKLPKPWIKVGTDYRNPVTGYGLRKSEVDDYYDLLGRDGQPIHTSYMQSEGSVAATLAAFDEEDRPPADSVHGVPVSKPAN